jgi:hypothetical protein
MHHIHCLLLLAQLQLFGLKPCGAAQCLGYTCGSLQRTRSPLALQQAAAVCPAVPAARSLHEAPVAHHMAPSAAPRPRSALFCTGRPSSRVPPGAAPARIVHIVCYAANQPRRWLATSPIALEARFVAAPLPVRLAICMPAMLPAARSTAAHPVSAHAAALQDAPAPQAQTLHAGHSHCHGPLASSPRTRGPAPCSVALCSSRPNGRSRSAPSLPVNCWACEGQLHEVGALTR